jgi:hypothetical protein
MTGRATPTIDTSSASRPTTRETVSRTPQRRGVHCVEEVDREAVTEEETTCVRI